MFQWFEMQFFETTINYLVQIVNGDDIHQDSKQVQSIISLPPPTGCKSRAANSSW